MKSFLFVLLISGFAACGNGGSAETSDTNSVTVDSSFSRPAFADSSASNAMNADTSGMGNAR